MEFLNEAVVDDIEQTFGTLIDMLLKFDRTTLNTIPFEGSWTAGQTVEHIVICGKGIPDKKTQSAGRPYDEKVQALKELFLNFTIKFEADPALEPIAPPHGLEKIDEVKKHLKTVAETRNLSLLCLDMDFLGFGNLTRYEWLRFILFHTQRHTRQIENIYASIQLLK